MNAYTLKCLPELGVDIKNLGCVMLDVEPLDIRGRIPEEWAYYSENPKLQHVNGIQKEAHVTLLFGLLQNANTIKFAVDEVLAGWEFPEVYIDEYCIDVFDSPIADEKYSCIVARVDSDELVDAHSRLSFLPHINTHPVYKPHFTIAYVKREHTGDAAWAIKDYLNEVGYVILTPIGLNYGKKP